MPAKANKYLKQRAPEELPEEVPPEMDWKDELEANWLAQHKDTQGQVLRLPESFPVDGLIFGFFNGPRGCYVWYLQVAGSTQVLTEMVQPDLGLTEVSRAAQVEGVSRLLSKLLQAFPHILAEMLVPV